MSAANTGFTATLTATGSAPITYSLESASAAAALPDEISIDETTGLLSVKGGVYRRYSGGHLQLHC